MRAALVLACIAAGWALVSNDWLSGAGANSVGLFGVEMCADYCRLETWDTLRAPFELLLLGAGTGLGLIKMIAFAIHALAVTDKARVKVRWTIATAAMTIVLGTAFIVRAPWLLPGMPLALSCAGFVGLAATIAMAALVRAVATAAAATRTR
jgi:hypothetical protein